MPGHWCSGRYVCVVAGPPRPQHRHLFMPGHSADASTSQREACETCMQGWRALFRGNGANVARSAPQKALDFFAFDALKDALSAKSPGGMAGPRGLRGGATASGGAAAPARARPTKDLGTLETLTAAGLAGAVSSTVLYPLEVVRTRLSSDTAGLYRGMGDTFRVIVRQEGPAALYRCAPPPSYSVMSTARLRRSPRPCARLLRVARDSFSREQRPSGVPRTAGCEQG